MITTMPIVIGGTGIPACAAHLVQCEHKDSASGSHRDEKLITGWKPVLLFLIFHFHIFPLTLPIVIGGTGILACAAYLVQCEHKDSASRSHHDENLFTIFILIR